MKRLLFAFLLSSGLYAASFAQVAPAAPATVKEHKKSTGTTKSGKPDMRLKANRDAAKAQPAVPAPAPKPVAAKTKTIPSPAVIPQPAVAKARTRPAPSVTPAPAPAPRPAVASTTKPAVASADPVIGTDAKGRTIYRGKRGGTYYINKNGNKEYIKQ